MASVPCGYLAVWKSKWNYPVRYEVAISMVDAATRTMILKSNYLPGPVVKRSRIAPSPQN
jgi:hypothetical protein